MANEPDAKKSLWRVIASRNRLREISHELNYLVNEAKREVYNKSQSCLGHYNIVLANLALQSKNSHIDK